MSDFIYNDKNSGLFKYPSGRAEKGAIRVAYPYYPIYSNLSPPPNKNKAQEMQIYQHWLLNIH